MRAWRAGQAATSERDGRPANDHGRGRPQERSPRPTALFSLNLEEFRGASSLPAVARISQWVGPAGGSS